MARERPPFVSLISGRIAPSAGIIRFEGRDITNVPAFRRVQQGIAYTFQITSIYANLSVAENVALAAHSPGSTVSGTYLETRSASRIARVRWPVRSPMDTSGLLEVAMGLALRAEAADPRRATQGLSDGEIANFIDLVRGLSRETTVLLIEHNMPVVMQTGHRITVLDRGMILRKDRLRRSAAMLPCKAPIWLGTA